MNRATAVALVAAAGVVSGCLGTPSGEARLPEYAPKDQATTAAGKSPTRPLILEWPAADRAALEAQRATGVVVVTYSGGEMTVLGGCRAAGKYRYVSLTPKEEGLTMHDSAELAASMPMHAASLDARLAQNQDLTVSMTIVGTYQADPRAWTSSDLQGACSGATHVLQALTVGAFEIAASAKSAAKADAKIGTAGVEAHRDSSREVLHRDGKKDACGKSAARDDAPPYECGAMLRVEVSPIRFPEVQVGHGQAACGPGLVRTSDGCQSVAGDRPPLLDMLQGQQR